MSQTIRTYVEEEENCSVYSQILGKLVRASWRERLQIVNSGEAVVVVDALLNLTDSQVRFFAELPIVYTYCC